MNNWKISLVVLCAAAAFVAVTAVTASPSVNTPLYTYRMEQASSKMNFLPITMNTFTYTAEKGYTLKYEVTGEYCYAVPLDTFVLTCNGWTHSGWTCWPSCGGWTCSGATCYDSCGMFTCAVPESCSYTCTPTCPETCDTCQGQGWTCNATGCQNTCETCNQPTCAVTCSTCETCGTCLFTCDTCITCEETCMGPECIPLP